MRPLAVSLQIRPRRWRRSGKSTSTIVLDGEKIALDGYIINGNNYYKLRDIGKAIGFDVDFDNASSTVLCQNHK